jgi:hypothetical protein
MKHILLSASLLLIAISTQGQTASLPPQPCTIKLSQAPSVRGVKLNMTVDELLPLFPGSSDSGGIKNSLTAAEGYPNFGYGSFGISPSNWANKERFAGISSYFFSTFDRRIVALTITYDRFPEGARWKNPDDLIQRFSDSLHLPAANYWAPDPDSNSRKKLKCDGFEIFVTAGEQSAIAFYNRDWEGTKKERQAAFEEQKRREFKP